MIHKTKVIEKKVEHGQFSVKIRCCEDPDTDQWHTVAPELVSAGFDAQHRLVAAHHDLLIVAKQHLDSVSEEEKEHNL